MHLNRCFRSVSITLGLALLPAVSCACIYEETSTQQKFDTAEVVLAGTVMRVEPRHGRIVRTWSSMAPTGFGGDPQRADEGIATVRVTQAFKGVADKEQVKAAASLDEYSICARYSLRSGQRVLLFAHRLESGELRVNDMISPFDGSPSNASVIDELYRLERRIPVKIRSRGSSRDTFWSWFVDVVEATFQNSSQFILSKGETPRTLVVTISQPVERKYESTEIRVSYNINFTTSQGEPLGAVSGSCFLDAECFDRIIKAASTAVEKTPE